MIHTWKWWCPLTMGQFPGVYQFSPMQRACLGLPCAALGFLGTADSWGWHMLALDSSSNLHGCIGSSDINLHLVTICDNDEQHWLISQSQMALKTSQWKMCVSSENENFLAGSFEVTFWVWSCGLSSPWSGHWMAPQNDPRSWLETASCTLALRWWIQSAIGPLIRGHCQSSWGNDEQHWLKSQSHIGTEDCPAENVRVIWEPTI